MVRMRALTFHEYGPPSVLRVDEVPLPAPAGGEVRIRVAAAPAQPVDAATRAGVFAGRGPDTTGRTLGWDVAGTVDAVGDGVTGFAVGDEVVGLSDWFAPGNGAQAEYVVLPAAAVARAPAGVSAVEASTLPLNAQTASQALDLLDLPAGATLAVTGAAGSVGGYAVELAIHRGLRVVAIAGAADEEWLRGRGATFVRRADAVGDAVRAVVPEGVDGFFDPAGVGAPALGAVRDGGRYVIAVGTRPPAGERGISTAVVMVHSDGAELARLAGLVESGALTLRVAGAYPLEDAATVHELLAKGGVRGRLVFVP
ncbi:NADPH:quinone reductase [Virgisporangium aliadipatigenens]|uniref:NADPH:quinone reductase n=2 Tax=Virgisporangium aliadipatigenens TaxID=741659 RepID=A0A8J4DN42_9ACTN|nr:NADPH:quinone reductase [Virgisporangium aliadipatigenens]